MFHQKTMTSQPLAENIHLGTCVLTLTCNGAEVLASCDQEWCSALSLLRRGPVWVLLHCDSLACLILLPLCSPVQDGRAGKHF